MRGHTGHGLLATALDKPPAEPEHHYNRGCVGGPSVVDRFAASLQLIGNRPKAGVCLSALLDLRDNVEPGVLITGWVRMRLINHAAAERQLPAARCEGSRQLSGLSFSLWPSLVTGSWELATVLLATGY